METLYHGTDYLFNRFLFKNVGKKSGTTGAGFGLYFSNSKVDAMCYGKYVYTVNVQLQNMLDNNRISLSKDKLRAILEYFESITEVSYCELFGKGIMYVVCELLKNNSSDTEIIGDIVNGTGQLDTMMRTLVRYGYTHSIDTDTPEDKQIINYVIYDLNCIKIVKREKSLDSLTESVIEEQLIDVNDYCDLMEDTTFLAPMSNIPEPLVSLSGNMSRDNKTLTLDQAQGRAKSKSQRRLMAMALAYKRGKLPDKYASDTIKKLSKSIGQDTLKDFAKTKQKKRRKDGSVGKRNNIPERVKKTKK